MSFEYTTPAITKWRLDDFMDVIDRFEDDFGDSVHHKVCVSNDYQTILLHIAGKSLVTAREILTLCAHGYPDGALSLGRNLYEQMMIASFFEMHKNDADFQEYVNDFFLSYRVQRNKCLKDIDKYVPHGDIAELKKEQKQLQTNTKRKIKGDYWWAACGSFSELVERVLKGQTEANLCRFLGIHYARYKRACISLHASCMGNSNRLGNDVGFNVVDTAPTEYGQSTPLVYATISLIAIIGFICSAFQIDNAQYIKPLNELAIYYQEQEKEDMKRDT